MKLETKRLFINSLPNNVTEAELEQKFKDYGAVSSVEIKEHKNVTGSQTKHFAYILLEAENYKLQNCIDDFSHTKWKGHFIDVQVAKESFIERLKREREEVKVNGVAKPSTSNVENHVNAIKINDVLPMHTTRLSTTIPIYPEDRKRLNNANASINLRKYYSSSSEDEQEKNSEDLKTDPTRSNSVVDFDEDVDELVIKNNKGSKFKQSLKIEAVGNAPTSVEKESAKPGVKENRDDKKRLQSIMQMKQEYQQQKALIKNALANIDSKPKNKITFNDDDGGSGEVQPAKRVRFDTNAKRKDADSSKLSLFDEDDENDHEYNFEVKEQFEGKKGKKLMELQSKFKNDKRFSMDARFVEDESDDDEETPRANEEISMEEEKNKQLDILEQVLGKKIPRTDKQAKDSKRHKMMMRFDPSQPEHSKYELKDSVIAETTRRKRKNSEKESEHKTEEEEAPVPEVSKDTFYKVAVNLKDALHKKEEFSLTSLFNKEIENEEQDEPQVEDKPKEFKKHKKLNHEANPFKYDSSTDDESDNEKANEKSTTDAPIEVKAATSFQRLGPTRLWTESFFFKDDDYRLQEGFDFIKKLELNEQDDFSSLRRNLKEIVRAKVRNNQRNNRPFKKKLGGKKRIRVKRALKR